MSLSPNCVLNRNCFINGFNKIPPEKGPHLEASNIRTSLSSSEHIDQVDGCSKQGRETEARRCEEGSLLFSAGEKVLRSFRVITKATVSIWTDFWLYFLYGDDTDILFNCWQYVQFLRSPSRSSIPKDPVIPDSGNCLNHSPWIAQIGVIVIEGCIWLTHTTSDQVISIVWLEGLGHIKNNTSIFHARVSVCIFGFVLRVFLDVICRPAQMAGSFAQQIHLLLVGSVERSVWIVL